MSPPEVDRTPAWVWVVRTAASLLLAAVMIVVVLPHVTGARWSQIGHVLAGLTVGEVGLLTAVWLLGLWCYSFTLTGTVPGLTRPQALTVNVAGSAVSNLVPFGGALGLATTFGILRSWGFAPAAVGLSALVTGVWNVLAKLALPLAGLLALLVAGDAATGRFAAGAAAAAAVLAVALGLLAGVLSSERIAEVVGRATERFATALLRTVGSSRKPSWEHALPEWRLRVIHLVRAACWHLTFGLAGFLTSQALLLYLGLHLLGSSLGPAQVFAGYAFGRLLSTLVITPGGVGITETGVAGLLVAFGGNRTVCASAVLLSSGFTFFAEFPAGATGYLVWLLRRSWRAPARPPSPPDLPA